MFYFAIPLRAKATSKSWGDVCQLLRNTINSISESGADYKIIIACHDKPDFFDEVDTSRVEFIQVQHQVPLDKSGYMADKTSKKNAARKRILGVARPGDFFMFMDADDLVSKDFFEKIESVYHRNPDADDLALYAGYVYDVGRKKLAYLDGEKKFFYRNCGSCFISKLRDVDFVNEDKGFLCSLVDHTKFPESSLVYGRSVMAVKIPVVCYLVNHGSNDASERVSSSHIESFVDSFLCHEENIIKRFNSNFSIF